MVILGISTNTRLTSYAIISPTELIKYVTHLHKVSWTSAKTDQIIASLEPCVRQYCITTALLSIPYEHYQTASYKVLKTALSRFFSRHRIPFKVVTPPELAAWAQHPTEQGKKALMEVVVARYPELRICQQKELRNRSKYYYKLFEAVAVAHRELDQQH